VPLRFLLSGGQASDIAYAKPLLDEACIPSLRGRPRKRCRWLLACMGYDAEALRQYCDRQHNVIERMFGWLKESCGIVTRFYKLAKSFEGMISLACAMPCVRQYFRTEPSPHANNSRAMACCPGELFQRAHVRMAL